LASAARKAARSAAVTYSRLPWGSNKSMGKALAVDVTLLIIY
jgi:hypothetical protein